MSVFNITDKSVRGKWPDTIALDGVVIGKPTIEQCRAAGWREVVPDATATPEGQRIAAVTYVTDGDRVREERTFAPIPPPLNPLAGFEGAFAEFSALAKAAKVAPGPAMMAEMVAAAKEQATVNRMIALRLDLSPVWGAVLAAMEVRDATDR